MDAIPSVWLGVKLIVLFAGLIGPGAAWMRALRLPCTLATSFAGSAVAIYTIVSVLALTSTRIAFGSVAAGLAIVTLLAAVAAAVRRRDSVTMPARASPAGESATDSAASRWWLVVYGMFWLAVVWRGWREPLAGPDIEFRWSFLAEQMLRLGSLDFYPPHRAADFIHYFWAESIPPGVSSLHAWAYACAGGPHAAFTVPGVLLQLVAVHEVVWRTARSYGGVVAGRAALLALAACPLLTWAVLLGQESGFTALSLVGILFALQELRQRPGAGWAAAVGVFAALGACSREYGLVFPTIAAAGLVLIGADRRSWFAFVPAAVLSAAWPCATFIRTGNPFYSLPLGPLTTNPLFVAWIRHDSAALAAPLHTAAGWLQIGRYAALFAPMAVAGAAVLVVAMARRQRDAAFAAAAAAVVIALWLLSVPYTNGGLFYSLRVLSPALAVAAVAAGVAAARWPRAAAPAGATLLALAGIAVLLLPATLALPQNPWRTPIRHWPAFEPPQRAEIDPTVAIVLRDGRGGLVLADSPGFQRRFQPHGISVVPLWSAQAAGLLAANPTQAGELWRSGGVRYIIVTKYGANLDFFNRHTQWGQRPFEVQLIGESPEAAVFAVQANR